MRVLVARDNLRQPSAIAVSEMSETSFTSKDSALRAVGRTIVNLQRLEHNLKLAARLGPLQGTIDKIQRDAERRAERAATLTLGQAIQAWLAAAHSEPVESGQTADLFDVTMQITMSLVPDAEMRATHGVALQSLLETRNRLVHGGLVRMQWDSPEACAQLVEDLDAVNDEIRVQMDFVTAILNGVRTLGEIRQEDWERAIDGLAVATDRELG